MADEGDPFEKSPADESPAKLGHGGGGVMGQLGGEKGRETPELGTMVFNGGVWFAAVVLLLLLVHLALFPTNFYEAKVGDWTSNKKGQLTGFFGSFYI